MYTLFKAPSSLALEQIINLMQATPDVKPYALAYLNVRLLSAPALLIQNVCVGSFRGHKDSKTPLKVALVAQFCNLTLDIVFIYGRKESTSWLVEMASSVFLLQLWPHHCHCLACLPALSGFGWGVVGAAAASVVAQYISAIGLLYFLFQR